MNHFSQFLREKAKYCKGTTHSPYVNQGDIANDVGVDAVADGDTGNASARLQAFPNDLGLEWFGIRASLAHGNPGDKGDRVRLKIGGHHRP